LTARSKDKAFDAESPRYPLTAALHFARQDDILVALPELMSRPAIKEVGLDVRPMPLDLPPVPLVLAWHQRYDSDRARSIGGAMRPRDDVKGRIALKAPDGASPIPSSRA
jgi:DNA-binding transcriptional LysR family regulator